MKTKSKYEKRTTAMKAKGIYGDVHCSVCYRNDEPDTIGFTQHRKGDNGETEYHSVSLFKEDLPKLVQLLKENKLI